MSESYTPSTDEIETAATTYMWETERDCPGTYVEAPKFSEYVQVCAAFRRWHTAEIRRAKAEALRGCAAVLEAVPDYAPSGYDQGRVDQRHMTITELLERADQIEKEADDDHP